MLLWKKATHDDEMSINRQDNTLKILASCLFTFGNHLVHYYIVGTKETHKYN